MKHPRPQPNAPFKRLRLAALLPLAAACPVLAQTAPGAPADAQAVTLPAVTVQADAVGDTNGYQPVTTSSAGPTPQAIRDIPRSVAVVSHQVMEDQQARSLDDVLANVSGVIQTNTLGGTRDSFLKRGFGSNDDGSILRDGLRSPVLKNYLATIDQVDVLKGPTSLLYGIQEPGGVINMITKKPQAEFGGSVTLGHDSNATNSGTVDLTGPIGRPGGVAGGTLAYRLIAEDSDGSYWRTFGTSRHALVAPSLSWSDADTSILFSYQHVDYSEPWDRGIPLINGRLDDSLRRARYEEAWSRSYGTQENAQMRIDHRLSDQWSLRASYGWSRERYDQYLTRGRSVSAAGIVSRSSDANLGRNDSDSIATVGAMGDLNIGGLRNQVYFGGEYERQREFRGDTIRGNAVNGFNLFDPVYGRIAAGGKADPTQSDNLSLVHTGSLVAQDTISLTERLSAQLGVRYEHYEQYSGVGRPFVVSDDSNGHAWLPSAGLSYRISPALSVYGSFSRSFVPNVSADAVQPLAPERGRSFETGLKFDLDPGITGTLAVYQIDKSNVAVSDGDVTSTIGSARSRGVELDVAGRINNHWSVIGSYAYTAAADRQANVPLINVPRHSGSLYAVYATALPSIPGQWRFGGGMRLVGQRPGDSADSFTLPGYGVVDAFVSYETKIGKFPTKFQLSMKNLFNKTYYPSSASNLIVAVGQERVTMLTTSVSF